MKRFICLHLFVLLLCAVVDGQDKFAARLSDAAIALTQSKVSYDPSYYVIDYPNGDVPSDRGVCTDVVIRAYRVLGIDLQKEVHEDMRDHFGAYPAKWGLQEPDSNIDHRRVPNLMTYFERHAIKKEITANPKDYLPGDIVCWDAQNWTHPQNNQTYKEYVLPKNIALGIVSGYSFELRMKIINRLEQLENERKNLFSIPQTYSEALMLAAKQAEQIEQQKELIAIQAPKVDFYEAVTGSTDTIDIGTVAKVLNIDGYGRTRLFAFLRDKGVLRANNEPYQTYCDRGYFRVIESKFSKPDGSTHVSLKTVVYQKGVDYIRKLVLGAQ